MNIKQITFAALLAATAQAQAQNTYINDRLTATDQLNGSARFVGMGGALGALGADLSVISSNPAGMGLYRKSDIGMSFGAVIPNGNGWDMNLKSTYGENLSRASFDQFGGVLSLRTGGSKVKRVNIGFNYQKKLNFNQGFFADNDQLGGLSQMTQLADLVNGGYDTDSNLAGLAAVPYAAEDMADMDEYYLSKGVDDEGREYRYNNAVSESNNYTRHQRGALKAYDLNLAMNINDRVYVGATLGIDQLDYKEWNEYAEYAADGGLNHSLYNDTEIGGVGVSGKFGIIARPFEYSSFRVGLAVETPTWYRMDNSTLFNLDKSDQLESYLEYTVRTPWKVRVSAGHTVGTTLAWGVEYEYANYAKTRMGYPAYDVNYPEGSQFRTADWDMAMNELTRNTLCGQHTLRLGVEVNPLKKFAIRAGYNYISSRYNKTVNFDQYSIDSRAMDFATNTEYMRLGDTNIISAGLGYRGKVVYVDLTYQLRAQHGDFYSFADIEQGARLQPVDVNLNRHQLMLGVGVKL
ncbi:MAG: hypothetical protein UHL07_08520 [Bacteroidaceae bacterium]|nr:hypothetical protein [Bacteroidaceae bacterium]